MNGFKIENPGDYFKNQADNVELECNVLEEFEFLMKTLELFGLPEDFMKGNGHWATWTKESAEGKDKGKKKGKKDNKKKPNFSNLAKKWGAKPKRSKDLTTSIWPPSRKLSKSS